MKRKHDILFLTLLSLVFIVLVAIFCFFPRSVFSELERRELKRFPKFSSERLKDGSFTSEVSEWFSDTEPYRDRFMACNMEFKKLLALARNDEDAVTFHASGAPGADAVGADEKENLAGDRNIDAIDGIGAEENGKLAASGIIIAGNGPQARALMIFGGSGKGTSQYAMTLNEYRRALPSNIRVYAMVIPTSIEFYCPEKVKKHTNSQLATIKNIYSQLDPSVTAVDVYSPLGHHASEPVYLRTDHHWSPLGAFYAAEQFAKTADVPFAPLSSYDKKVIHDFVGTMYGYSKDIAIKNAPEDFVYYTPKDTSYVATVIDFDLDKNFRIVKEYPARKSRFFYKFKDGSGMAYSTFMGGDRKIVSVKTKVRNGRKLLIIKDSFGNALPGYFFSSFGEVHVVDFRYFNRNLRKYISDNGITDVVIALNIFNAYSSSVSKKLSALLSNGGTVTTSSEEHRPSEAATPRTDGKDPKTSLQSSPNSNSDQSTSSISHVGKDKKRNQGEKENKQKGKDSKEKSQLEKMNKTKEKNNPEKDKQKKEKEESEESSTSEPKFKHVENPE